MHDTFMAVEPKGQTVGVSVDLLPDHCPECHMKLHPADVGFYLNGPLGEASVLQGVFRCPSRECGVAFLAVYRGVWNSYEYRSDYYFVRCEPERPQEPSVPSLVAALSPDFVNILGQASAAEAYSLNEVCGPGYRKALEFLVKDYLIAHAATLGASADVIKSKQLGRCIEDHIEDAALKKAAKRAAWLGNDETHYYRKWDEHDLKDLKALLKITVNALDSQLVLENYESEMPG